MLFSFFNKVPTVTTEELKVKLTEKIVLLDVRTPQEYQAGHIAKSENVPLNKIENYTKHQNEEIYVICQSGMRSKQAVKVLQKKGYHAINVKGGMNQWRGRTLGGK